MTFEAAEMKAKIRRLAVAEKERIEIQLVEDQLAAELLEGDSVMDEGNQAGDAPAQGQVDAWLSSIHAQDGEADDARQVAMETTQPSQQNDG